MDRFIHDENVRHYRRLLERTSDLAERDRILKLLNEEEAAMAAAIAAADPARDRRNG